MEPDLLVRPEVEHAEPAAVIPPDEAAQIAAELKRKVITEAHRGHDDKSSDSEDDDDHTFDGQV